MTMPERHDEPHDREDREPRPPRRDDADDYDDRPRRRREPEIDATDFLVPMNVSGWSLAACYIGLVSCFPIPGLGLVLGIIALVSARKALRRRKKGSSYGQVTGDMRAVVGMVLGILSIICHSILLVFLIAGAVGK
jgi:hypothetical protein